MTSNWAMASKWARLSAAALVGAGAVATAQAQPEREYEVTFLVRDLYASPGNGSAVCVVRGGDRLRAAHRVVGYGGIRWAPDGRRFSGTHAGVIFVEDASSGARRGVASAQTAAPWSADGRWLLYYLRRGIWAVGPEGTGRHEVLHTPAGSYDYDPAWRGDGRIVFVRTTYPQPGADLISVAVDGTGLRVERHLALSSYDVGLRSPDGKLAARWNQGDQSLHLANIDGSADRVVARGAVSGLQWSPDSRQIAFVRASTRPSPPAGDVYVVDARAGTVRRLTSTPYVNETAPAWRVVGAPDFGHCAVPPPKPPWR